MKKVAKYKRGMLPPPPPIRATCRAETRRPGLGRAQSGIVTTWGRTRLPIVLLGKRLDQPIVLRVP